MNSESINLLVTLDENYLTQLDVMLFSLTAAIRAVR